MKLARTDRNNNPTAMTTDVCHAAGLVLDTDYAFGDSFLMGNNTLYTAKLLGDPISLTLRVLDRAGFYTSSGHQRWSYIAIPDFAWRTLGHADRIRIVEWMYHREGGSELQPMLTDAIRAASKPGTPQVVTAKPTESTGTSIINSSTAPKPQFGAKTS